MNSTNMSAVRWAASVGIVLGLSACGGGISIGKDDAKLGGKGSGGASKNDGAGRATAATTTPDPTSPPMTGSGGTVGAQTPGSAASTGVSGNTQGIGAGTTSACGSFDGWTRLVAIEGNLPQGDGGLCVRKTATTDMFLTALRGDSTGKGDAVLYASANTGPDGRCDGMAVAVSDPPRRVLAMTAGHSEVQLPDPQPIVVHAGEQLTLMIRAASPEDVGTAATASVSAIVASSGSDGTFGAGATVAPLAWENRDVLFPDGTDIATGNAAACDAPWVGVIASGGMVAPGEETAFCNRVTLETPIDMGAVRVLTASGAATVKNLTVTYLSPTDPGFSASDDGSCDALAPNLGGTYAGPFEVRFDDGTAPRIPSGYQIVVRGVVYNTTPMPYGGTIASLEYQASAP